MRAATETDEGRQGAPAPQHSGRPAPSRRTSKRVALRLAIFAWLAPGVALMVSLFIWPILLMFRDSIYDPALTFDNYVTIATDPLYKQVIWNSVRAAAQTTAGCILVGYPAAYLIFRSPPATRQ